MAESLLSRPAIDIRNLTLAYQGHPAVHHLSGTFASGSLTAIVGPNGAGKSTLLAALSGQKSGIEGSIDFPTDSAPARPALVRASKLA